VKQDFYIDRVTKKELEPLLLTYHYLKDESKTYKSGFNYGLFKHSEWECPLRIGNCLGACIFTGLPVPEIAVGAFRLQRHEQEGIYELSRLCIHPEVQKEEYNITSWFVSRCIRRFRKDARVRCILSYADANHHTGVIYRACNFTYYGLTDKKSDFWIKQPDGSFIKHSRGPIKGLEGEWRERSRKHRYLMIFDKELEKRLTWKEEKWYNNQDDTISLQ
jgi:hypothetical protein